MLPDGGRTVAFVLWGFHRAEAKTRSTFSIPCLVALRVDDEGRAYVVVHGGCAALACAKCAGERNVSVAQGLYSSVAHRRARGKVLRTSKPETKHNTKLQRRTITYATSRPAIDQSLLNLAIGQINRMSRSCRTSVALRAPSPSGEESMR